MCLREQKMFIYYALLEACSEFCKCQVGCNAKFTMAVSCDTKAQANALGYHLLAYTARE